MRYQLIIFDMDGTILDTLDDLAASVNFALQSAGYSVRGREEIRSFVGNGVRRLVERSLPQGAAGRALDETYAAFTAHYAAHCAQNTRPYDGVLQLLQDLRGVGCRTAVVSNKPDPAVQALCKSYFDGLFDCAVGEREGVRRKPAPDSVNEVLRKLDFAPSQAVYIGDSEVDVQTAAAARMDCVCVDWGFRSRAFLRAGGAARIASNAQALFEMLVR